jgi:hypothetical protein
MSNTRGYRLGAVLTGTSGLALSLLALTPSAGCGGDECTVGRQTSCACPDGSSGVQICGDDGTFGSCECDGGGGSGGTPTGTTTGGTGGMPTTTGGGGTGGTGGTGGGVTCEAPMELCGMDCVDTMTSNAHCGMCDEACPMDTSCQGGNCVCMGGGLLCDDTCTDVQNDAMNCGGCGHDCLGAACSAGICAPDTLANGLPEIYGLTLGMDDVYFVRGDLTNAVYEVPKDGSSNPSVLASGQTFPRQIGLDTNTDTLYWSVYGTSNNSGVIEYPLPNGPASPLVGADPAGTWGLQVEGGFVYYANQEEDTVKREDPSASGNPVNLGSLQARPWDLAVEGSFAYWTNYDSGDIRRVPVGGGQAPQIIASGQANPIGIATDATHVYWTSETAGTVSRAPLAGGTVEVLVTGQVVPTYLTMDETHVYWTNFGNGTVNRATKTGDDVLVLATGQNQPYDVEVDGTHVYWSTLAGGTVMRVPK